MDKIQTYFNGKKTYIVGVMGIISAIASYLAGDATLIQAGQIVLTSIIGITLKHGQATGA